MESPFNHPQQVKENLDLPTVVKYSFVGLSSPTYHARLEGILTRIAGEDNIRGRSYKQSSKGNYTAYRFEVFHDTFEDVEAIYREVGALPGTRFVV
ncbi:MAG: DUF493 domain-containing protein [Sumerlaeia bacterium]